MLDPVLHAALVTVALFFVRWLFALIGVNLGDDIAGQLATLLVAYILSLFGYGLYIKAKINFLAKRNLAIPNDFVYHPPFS